MSKFIPLKSQLFVCAYIAILAESFLLASPDLLPDQIAVLGLHDYISTRIVALIVVGFLTTVYWRPVWRCLWSLPAIGPFLSKKVFPDLNGEWEFEMSSNWPIIEAMRNASSAGTHTFDVLSPLTDLPALQKSNLPVLIEQNWREVKVTVKPTGQSVLQVSKTLSVDLLAANELDGKRLAWTFKQTNKQPRAHSDVESFLGSALLEVSDDGRTLEGHYWNNRSWDRGLNPAGTIIGHRVS